MVSTTRATVRTTSRMVSPTRIRPSLSDDLLAALTAVVRSSIETFSRRFSYIGFDEGRRGRCINLADQLSVRHSSKAFLGPLGLKLNLLERSAKQLRLGFGTFGLLGIVGHRSSVASRGQEHSRIRPAQRARWRWRSRTVTTRGADDRRAAADDRG